MTVGLKLSEVLDINNTQVLSESDTVRFVRFKSTFLLTNFTTIRIHRSEYCLIDSMSKLTSQASNLPSNLLLIRGQERTYKIYFDNLLLSSGSKASKGNLVQKIPK